MDWTAAAEEAYKNGFTKGYLQCRADIISHQSWIPCSEHLPTDDIYNKQLDWVLVATKMVPEGYYGVPHIAEYRRGQWYFQDCDYRETRDTTDEEFTSVTVTHWMPITPENPEINKG